MQEWAIRTNQNHPLNPALQDELPGGIRDMWDKRVSSEARSPSISAISEVMRKGPNESLPSSQQAFRAITKDANHPLHAEAIAMDDVRVNGAAASQESKDLVQKIVSDDAKYGDGTPGKDPSELQRTAKSLLDRISATPST